MPDRVPATDLRITVVTVLTTDVESLVDEAVSEVSARRGGPRFVESILAGHALHDVLVNAATKGELTAAFDEQRAVGVALCRNALLEVLYVRPSHRRRGIARAMVRVVVQHHESTLDAYALPGDRATKSLYESLGWKARLLTMSAE